MKSQGMRGIKHIQKKWLGAYLEGKSSKRQRVTCRLTDDTRVCLAQSLFENRKPESANYVGKLKQIRRWVMEAKS